MHFGFVLTARVIYNKNSIYFPRIDTSYVNYIDICKYHTLYYMFHNIPTWNGQRSHVAQADYEQINLLVSKCTLICVQSY